MAPAVSLRAKAPAIPAVLPHPRLRAVDVPALRPALAVVIVNFCQWRNTARLTKQLRDADAVRSGRAEIVVVDNHSPRHPILHRLRRRPGVSLRRLERNFGFATAVNEGCRLSDGDWVLVLNPDMSVPPNFLDEVCRAAEARRQADPQAGVIGFKLRHGDGSLQASCGSFPTLVGTLLGRFLPRSRRKCRPRSGSEAQRVPWVTGCCLLVRRDCFEELGGFDEQFFLYYEDVDFCRRATTAGWTVWFDPSLTITHHTPLHKRRVPTPLRLMTRHALLTYAGKHWSRPARSIMAGIVWTEATVRRFWAGLRGQTSGVRDFAELQQLVIDHITGRSGSALERVLRIGRRLEGHARAQDGKLE